MPVYFGMPSNYTIGDVGANQLPQKHQAMKTSK
jgi:hypothetical protein